MKRMIAFLLAFCLMLGAAAAAGEAEPAADNGKLFREGLAALLSSINLETDELTLTMDQPEARVSLRQADGLTDLRLQAGGQSVHVQFDEEQVCLENQGAVFQLKYREALEALQGADAARDRELIREAFQLFVMKVLVPHAAVSRENGLRVTFKASGEELLEDAAGFADDLLADEKYDPLLTRLLAALESVSGQAMPALPEIKAQWPRIREGLPQAGAGFSVNFVLDASPDRSRITVTGEAGTEEDRLLMNLDYSRSGGEMTLTGRLTERVAGSSGVREHEISLDASFSRLADGTVWSVDVRYPDRAFSFSAEGTHLGESGQFSMSLNGMSLREYSGSVYGSYAVTDGGIIAQLNVAPRRTASFTAQLTVLRDRADLTVTNSQGLKLFSLKLELRDRVLTHAVLLMEDQRRPAFRAEYDMEKLVVTQGKEVYTFTGEYVTGQNYVLTIRFENVGEESGTVFLSAGYYGEPGNWRADVALTGPDGGSTGTYSLTCVPGPQEVEKLSEADGLVTLTPEMLLKLLQQ